MSTPIYKNPHGIFWGKWEYALRLVSEVKVGDRYNRCNASGGSLRAGQITLIEEVEEGYRLHFDHAGERPRAGELSESLFMRGHKIWTYRLFHGVDQTPRVAVQEGMAPIILYCNRWSYVRINRVNVRLNDYDVTRAVAELYNATTQAAAVDADVYIQTVEDEGVWYMAIPGGESATFEDLGEALEVMFKAEVKCVDTSLVEVNDAGDSRQAESAGR